MKLRAERFHDICAGHRVCGHEGKCRHLHGHNYRIHFICEGDLDPLGRVIDFSVIKEHLCDWLEEEWDHRFLLWEEDPLLPALREIEPSLVALPFNPSAENLAAHLLQVVGPQRLAGTGVLLREVLVEETRRCQARASL
ncbi:MAG: hypothetical protein RL095_3020 [Verrucomicrobiota bacterium]|jgi:6-pyruvoyltetrahydropterin/6-carboxytetrahydropterin synthase